MKFQYKFIFDLSGRNDLIEILIGLSESNSNKKLNWIRSNIMVISEKYNLIFILKHNFYTAEILWFVSHRKTWASFHYPSNLSKPRATATTNHYTKKWTITKRNQYMLWEQGDGRVWKTVLILPFKAPCVSLHSMEDIFEKLLPLRADFFRMWVFRLFILLAH